MNEEETVRKKSLLEKYEIPIDHLDFAYIKSCTHLKELERIVKILRSHEEGDYPELLNEAEEKLRELDPGNRLLRTQGKPLTRHMLEPAHWKQVIDDIQNWSDELSKKDKALVAEKNNSSTERLPPVRKPIKNNMDSQNDGSKKKEERIKGFEYDKWDKFDVEAECLKMEIEDEKKLEMKKKNGTNEDGDYEDELTKLEKDAAQEAKGLTKTEKEIIATKEKDLGNECYKLGDNKQALRHYSKSIAVFPTAISYNNRAAAYLRLESYEKALEDSTLVLQMEPTNIKALYRRAQACHSLKNYDKALLDVNEIIKLDPKHSAALQMKSKLIELISGSNNKSQSKKARLMEEEVKRRNEEALMKRMRDEARPGPSGINTKLLKSTLPPPPPVKQKTKPVVTEVNEGVGVKKEDKKGMKRLVVVEVEREEGTTGAGGRRQRGDGDVGNQVQVAHKYRGKAASSAMATKGGSQSSVQTVSPAPADDPQRRPSPDRGGTMARRQVHPVKVEASRGAGTFTQAWDSVDREGLPLKEKAALLRTVRPHLLQAVVGNKLEEKMLTDFLMCLKDEFKPKTEPSLIIEYLTAIANLERFSIICSFLPSSVKKLVIEELMEKVDADNCLRNLYL